MYIIVLTSKVNWVIFKNINRTKFIVDIVKWKKNSNEKWLKTFQRLICRPFSSKVQLEKKTFGIVIIKSIELYDIPYSKSKMKSPEIYKLTRRIALFEIKYVSIVFRIFRTVVVLWWPIYCIDSLIFIWIFQISVVCF